MGRIKTREIKRIGEQLVSEHGDKFSSSFDQNKEVYKQVVNVGLASKRMRNKILGYVTSLKKGAAR